MKFFYFNISKMLIRTFFKVKIIQFYQLKSENAFKINLNFRYYKINFILISKLFKNNKLKLK
jgi:hypothetical protein